MIVAVVTATWSCEHANPQWTVHFKMANCMAREQQLNLEIKLMF